MSLSNGIKVHGINTVQSAICAIPGIGGALEKLLFGAVAELRMQRVERTLNEMSEKLDELRAENHIEENEDFANLLEDILPPLSRATEESKRLRFRALLVKAAQLPVADPQWDDVRIATHFLKEVSGPGLEMLAALHRAYTRYPRAEHCTVSFGDEGTTITMFRHWNPSMGRDDPCKETFTAKARHIVAEQGFESLAGLGLIDYDGEGVLWNDMWRKGVVITHAGKFLIDWVLADKSLDDEIASP